MPLIPRFPRRLGGIALLTLAAAAALAGAGAVLALAVKVSTSVAVVALATLAMLFALARAFGGAALRLVGSPRPAHHGHRFGLTLTAALAVAAALLLFKPIETPANAPGAAADVRYWSLPTGSRLAYTHFPARGQRRAEPLVFLHGGPGAPLRESEYTFFSRFADEGYDVWLYEQIGAGRSDSPADLADYTVQRHVDDLEAIRQRIGAERMIVVGQSWGAALAAYYTAQHPQRVAALVLPSPGPLLNAAAVRANPARTAARGAPPPVSPWRVRVARWLADVNPALASDFAPPAEMNGYLDQLSPQLMRMSYCAEHGASVPREAVPGFNFYANRLTQRDLVARADPRPALAANHVPVLVLKGECDYVPASAMRHYGAFPNARIAVIERTGHLLWGGQPELTHRVISAFLDGRPLPVAELTF